MALTQEHYNGINHTQLTESLAEREGLMLSRPTVRRILGTGRIDQSPPPPATTTSVSLAADASGGDAAPTGREPWLIGLNSLLVPLRCCEALKQNQLSRLLAPATPG